MGKALNLIGRKFGFLTVIKQKGCNKFGKIKWLCKCKCGKEVSIIGSALKNSHTMSCGCKRSITRRLNSHGMVNSPEYQSWYNMIQRCTNPKNPQYNYYGGRGISVCNNWMKFSNFIKDMGKKPYKYTIDRIDNEIGYFKENCKWATRHEQAINRRTRSDNNAGVTGIRKTKYDKYEAYIYTNGRQKHIGTFKSIEEAKIARIKSEQIYWKR